MLKVFQIYFSEETKEKIEPEYIPYYNYPCSKYFESKVICDLVKAGEHLNSEWFGVLSANLRTKIQTSKLWGKSIANQSMRDFSPGRFENFVKVHKADIASYSKHLPHRVYPSIEKYHPGICEAIQTILQKLKYGVNYNMFSYQVIYFNYFIARPHIYEDYVKTLLIPVIDLMETDPQVRALVESDSKYPHSMPDDLAEQIGFNYWPMHSFICERLINLYLLKNNNKFKLIQW